jgi:hypothetical protein
MNHAALADILARLSVKPGEEGRVCAFATGLAALAAHANRPTHDPLAFRKVGRARAKSILAALHRAARIGDVVTAQRRLDALPGPVIDALADLGVVRHHLTRAELPALATATRRAKISRIPKKQGRQPAARDRYVAALADALTGMYFALTGARPTVGTRFITSDSTAPYGAFYDLVRDVFAALDINRSAEAAARAACRRFSIRLLSVICPQVRQ